MSLQGEGVWFVVCAVITAINALTSLGFSLASLRDRGDVSARYAAVRSLALVVGVVLASVFGAVFALFLLALVMTIVQALDAVVGVTLRNVVKTVGPASLAILTLVAALLMGPS